MSRRGGASLLALAILVALSGTIVLATAAGARRTVSAFDRFVAHTRASHVGLGQDFELRPEVDRAMRSLPGVAAAGSVAFLVMAPEGIPQADANAVAPADASWSVRVDRPFVVAGRLPATRDEVAVNEAMADRLQVQLGERITFRSFASSQLTDVFSGAAREPAGPRVTPQLVGILRHPRDLALGSENQMEAFFPRAFYESLGGEILTFGPSLMLRLTDGAAGIEAFTRAVAEAQAALPGSVQQQIEPIAQDDDIRVTNSHELYRPVRDAARIQALAIGMFSLLVALTSVIVLGLALARQAAGGGEDAPRLRALGMQRRQVAIGAMLPAFGAVAAGALIAIGGAAAASPLFPIGILHRIEPQPGTAFDGTTLLLGAAVFALAFGAVITLSVVRALGNVSPMQPATRRSAFTRAGLIRGSAPAAVGIRFAREPGSERSGVPVRSVTLGAGAGVLALVMALTFAGNLDRFVASPGSYGWNWDLAISAGDDPATMPRTASRLQAIPGIEASASMLLADVQIDEQMLQGAFFEALTGSISPTIVHGRAPADADEVALGSATMRRLGVSIGDSLAIRGTREAMFEVVGRGVLPLLDEGRLDDGVLFHDDARARIEPVPDFPMFPVVIASDDVRGRLEAEFGTSNVTGISRPGEVENLARIATAPWVLAAVLALLSVATIAHAVVLTTQRRARDLAVLKTLGFLRRQIRATVSWQACAFVVFACVIGVPAGVIAGRWSWIRLADRIGVAGSTTVSAWFILGVPLTLAACATAAAAVPARLAARTHPAEILRSE